MTEKEIEYYIYLKSYISKMKQKKEYMYLKDYDIYNVLFPKHWNDINDYNGKIELMKKAIESNENIRNINEKEQFEHLISFTFK